MENARFFHPAFLKLLVAQTQVAFNDNGTKLVLIGLVNLLLPMEAALRYVSLISLLLVSPFVFLAPMAGWLNDRFARRDVIRWSLWLQMAVMVFLIGAVLAGSLPLVMAGFLLLAVQSTFFSPAKRGILKELQPPERLQAAVGWAEMLCIGAILGGSLVGGFVVDALTAATKNPTVAAAASLGVFLGLCVVTAVIFRAMPRGEGNRGARFSWRALVGHGDLLRTLWVTPGVLRPVAAESLFYFVGGLLMITLMQMARVAHPDGAGAGGASGVLMALVGAGIGIGSLVAASLGRREYRVGVIPLAALGMAIGLLLLAAGAPTWIVLVGIGACGGLFCVPVSSALIERAPEATRGSVLAASSLCSSVTGMLAVAVQLGLAQGLGWGPVAQLVFLAVVMLAASAVAVRWLKVEILTLVARGLGHAFYRVRAMGVDHLPKSGGALLVCNHVSYVDAIILSLASERPIRFLSYEGFFSVPVLGWLLRGFGAIPVSGSHSKDAIRAAAARVREGELVGIFPEGQLSRTGSLMELKRGYELIARQAGKCAVIPVVTDGLWRSIFSFERGRYFFKVPNSWRIAVRVNFGAVLEDPSPANLRRVMSELGADAFAARPELDGSLDVELVRALRRRPWRVAVADYGLGGRRMRAGVLLGLSGAVAKRWREELTGGDRVGVILPPGIGGTVANVALLMAGKTPVNLNPTAGPAAMAHCLETAGIEVVVSAGALREKFADLPWPDRTVDVGEVIAQVSGFEFFEFLARSFFGSKKSKTSELILFTSGSSGTPKGVVLTSRNLLANAMQIDELGLLRRDEVVLSGLPLFHCFGLNVGMFSALLSGRRMVTVPTPFDYGKIAKAAKGEGATFLLATPTFLKGYLRKIPAEAFAAMRCVCCGAEKLPSSVAAATWEKFGAEAIEGYGLTETSPVVAFNQPDPECGVGADSAQVGKRAGCVGRLVPGVAWRLDEAGVMGLRGANVVAGYLGQEPAADGWFETGDVVSVDADGFVKIEGRTSRFSKIGGEMVPHAAVEGALAEAFADDLEGADCVVGVEVSEGEEELALVTTRELDREGVRGALRGAGLPNLWVPKRLVRVEKLPALASGKVDLAGCRDAVLTQGRGDAEKY